MIIDHMPWWTDRNKKFADECDHFCDEYLVPLATKLLENGEDPMDIQWAASKLCIEKGFHPLLVLVFPLFVSFRLVQSFLTQYLAVSITENFHEQCF